MDTPSIVRSLAPRVAVVASSDVDELCRKNGLANLVELIRPWENSLERVSLRTSQLATISAPSFPLRFSTLDALDALPLHSPATDKTELIVDTISALVSQNAKKWDDETETPTIDSVDGVDDRYLSKSIETLTPWYASFRDVVLDSRPVAEQETFNHPVAVVLAISSSNRDPMNAMAALYDRVNQSKFYSQRPFVDPTVLRYFVVVHDVGGGVDLEEAQKLLASIKRTYGLHCTLLPINSLSPTFPSSPFLHPLYSSLPPADPTTAPTSPLISTRPPEEGAMGEVGEGGELSGDGEAGTGVANGDEVASTSDVLLGGRLTDVDVTSLKSFLREMTVKSLVPFMEKSIGQWNELYASSRRGLTGRLFGAGRKFFGSSRPASPAVGGVAGYNIAKGYYPHQAAEAVSRRLADFAFVLRDYRFAASVYDSIRKDYAADKAYRYQAAANEMFGLSIIMTTPSRTRLDVDPFLEQAVLTYQSRGTAQLDAMRSTLLYYEGYRTIGEWRSVGPALLRAAGEVEEIPSAILLEQAALADLRLSKPAMRRYAFHLVMAAQRYEKCGQKSFSRRCLEQAIVLYRKQTWTRAQTHVEHALGRQAYTMGESDLAVDHFVRLLKGEQGAFLDDFVLAFEHLSSSNPEKVASLSDELPEPVFDQARTVVRSLSGTSSHKATDPGWGELQDSFLAIGYPTGESSRSKPRELMYSGPENIMSVGEPFVVDLVAHNPLDAPLSLGNVTLEAGLVPKDADRAALKGLEIETIADIQLGPGETRRISLTVKASSMQTIEFTHVVFSFHKLLSCRQPLARRGKRLHATKAQRLTPTYAPDTSLAVSIRPARPNLAVEVDGLPLALGQGESRRVDIELRNTGGAAMKGLRVLVSDPSVLAIGEEEGASSEASSSSATLTIPNDLSDTRPSEIALPGGTIEPGGTLSLSVLCHGQFIGAKELLLLFVYETCDEPSTTFSSTVSHSLTVEPVIQVFAHHRPSSSKPGNHLLALEIDSLSPSPVHITHITGLSPLWSLSPPAGRSSSSASASPLIPGRTHRSLLTISPTTSSTARQDMLFTATKLQRLLVGSTLPPTLPPPTQLHLSPPTAPSLPPLVLQTKAQTRTFHLGATYPLIPPSSLKHIFPLFEPRDLDLLVYWSIPSQDRQGHVLISGMAPGPGESIFLGLDQGEQGEAERVVRSMFEQTDVAKKALGRSVLGGVLGREEDSVRVTVTGGASASASFDVERGEGKVPRLVNVRYTLSNTSTSLSARVTFSLHHEPAPTRLMLPSFAGPLSTTLILRPCEAKVFETRFVAARAGTYDLGGCWGLEVETGVVVGGEAGEEDGWKGRGKWFEQRGVEERGVVVR